MWSARSVCPPVCITICLSVCLSICLRSPMTLGKLSNIDHKIQLDKSWPNKVFFRHPSWGVTYLTFSIAYIIYILIHLLRWVYVYLFECYPFSRRSSSFYFCCLQYIYFFMASFLVLLSRQKGSNIPFLPQSVDGVK